MPNSTVKSQELHSRVSNVERDIDQLTGTVSQLSKTLESGFQATRGMIESSTQSIQSEIKTINERHLATRSPNYNALGVAFAIIGTLLLWFVDSKVGPIAETLRGEAEARRAADSKLEEQRREFLERQATIDQTLFNRQLEAMVKIESLSTWDQARKLWKDHTP